MRLRRRFVAQLTMVGLIALLGTTWTRAAERAGQLSEQTQPAPRTGDRAIVGSWLVQVTLANCQTGEEIPGATFQALNTFLAEGSMLSDPASNPTLVRTGHGVWAYTGRRQVTNTVVLFRFNPDGSPAGNQTVRRHITVARNSNQFVAYDSVTTTDSSGTVIDTRCAVGRAVRLEF